MPQDPEFLACTPVPVESRHLNPTASLPYGCTPQHIFKTMQEFLEFLGFVNTQLYTHKMPRLEAFLMLANFSSIVGEFMSVTIPKHCLTVVKNQYHNGHPDLLPAGAFPKNAAQHVSTGIEVKASRHTSAWQGHNPEDIWLLVFSFDCNRPDDKAKNIPPKPFHFVQVAGALLVQADWQFSGRSETSRRTITASVKPSGHAKMMANWIYKD